MADPLSAQFDMDAFRRHLASDKPPFGAEFNATINEVVEGYRAVIAELQQELRVARFDADVPLREVREENERLRESLVGARKYILNNAPSEARLDMIDKVLSR